MTRFALTLSCIFFMGYSTGFSQAPSAKSILDKTIQYHDPQGEWPSFNHSMAFRSERPNGPDRNNMVTINNNKGYFRLDEENNDMVITMENCELIPSDKTCDQVKRTRNYYLYLWGLPMKLRDKGTPLDESVKEEEFNEYKCFVLRVPYEQDIWYFYIDQSNYALRGYMFYKDEPAQKGEVIYLEGESAIGKMKIPTRRSWYTTPDRQFLGTDILVSAN